MALFWDPQLAEELKRRNKVTKEKTKVGHRVIDMETYADVLLQSTICVLR